MTFYNNFGNISVLRVRKENNKIMREKTFTIKRVSRSGYGVNLFTVRKGNEIVREFSTMASDATEHDIKQFEDYKFLLTEGGFVHVHSDTVFA